VGTLSIGLSPESVVCLIEEVVMRKVEEIKNDCEKCAGKLTVKEMQEKNTCIEENCKIKKEYIEWHKETLCKICEVFGCANNPKGTGSRGAPLFFDIPDGCTMLDCDSSI